MGTLRHRPLGTWLLLLLLALAAWGCAADPGAQVADRIRAANSEVVREVVYRPADILDPPQVRCRTCGPVQLPQIARRLSCDTIVPAGGSQYGETAVVVWNDAGTEMMSLDLTCAPATP